MTLETCCRDLGGDDRAREKALRDEANRDYLTGPLNRRSLRAAINALRHV